MKKGSGSGSKLRRYSLETDRYSPCMIFIMTHCIIAVLYTCALEGAAILIGEEEATQFFLSHTHPSS